jgi:hypothetical protein
MLFSTYGGGTTRQLQYKDHQVCWHAPAVPKINKRRMKAPPSGEPPQRNRRIAGLQTQPIATITSQPKRRVMLCLGFNDTQQQHLCQQNQDDYAKLFLHPLSDVHVQALASLFGWTVPVNLYRGENYVGAT